MLRKLQEEEVRQAGIPDLLDCPFCSFATIMSDPNDRVFRCLNPECLKDSCRWEKRDVLMAVTFHLSDRIRHQHTAKPLIIKLSDIQNILIRL